MPPTHARRKKTTAADARRLQLLAAAEKRRHEVAATLEASGERIHAATEFVARWSAVSRERAEAQSFWNDLFAVLGLDRFSEGVIFEHPVTRTGTGGRGFIDVFWPGRILVEQKSRGKDLAAALAQADDYVLPDEDQPRLTVACDFETFVLRDNHTGRDTRFTLAELPQRLGWFGPLILDEVTELRAQAPVDVHAAEQTALIHDELRAAGYEGHDLRLLMTRLVFCFFANDTGIWPAGALEKYLRSVPASFMGPALAQLFQVLNTPAKGRQANITPELAVFPYVNGGLFADPLPLAAFSADLAERVLVTSEDNDWAAVSPAVFGAMFQGVMDANERHNLGAHYTSEENIRRVIDPLFLDDLYARVEAATTVAALEKVWTELSGLRFLDPAAGCGNFLVVSYRELRRLEKYLMHKLAALAAPDASRFTGRYPWAFGQRALDFGVLSRLSVGQFYGIEIDEWPAEIAKVAMWLTDHLANMELEADFGGHQARLPLTESIHMTVGNALRTDWEDVLPAAGCSYLYGNPPFLGANMQSADQKTDHALVWGRTPRNKSLDYVTCWFKRAADYLDGHQGRAAFVSTNSVSQGEQPSVLWGYLYERGYDVDFAHQSFSWTNEARGKAAVHVVITGFSQADRSGKRSLFTYPDPKGAPLMSRVDNINGYLISGPNVVVPLRKTPLSTGAPKMLFGSMARDGGHLFCSPEEAATLRENDPAAAKYLRRAIGAAELIQGKERWCLWLEGADPRDLRASQFVRDRTGSVRDFRAGSKAQSTVQMAATPTLFGQRAQPTSRYLAVPRVSSERRPYVPMALAESSVIATDALLTIDGADEVTFGVLSSRAFNVWLRAVSGRMKSDYRISAEVTYNNFPWPDLEAASRAAVSSAGAAVLEARQKHPDATLADLYDPLAMPADLVKAHKVMDKLVLGLYGLKAAATDEQILAALFARYQELTQHAE